ncbi:large conductance mechanosensitive channel protein MscL [Myroides pelagicus]|uniref:Large-conductance mechanosensitive channel n=1 Tax=Myroides pelagicus TaxID=270914 RepID=A0A7K1GKX4_9FLAO|nr:large conductance mechanosensitive channel protein MscL [Myroides pelagicus]MEC4112621.1 large conductance mechanosensitive channel protein MscL [Myroides pelagicus]MTH29501.1 large conductance mechanosensitive channel protein MscL [Myroides pelagicus]
MGFLKEFKEFAVKGNVMDLAVGVIIGGAFGKIVTSAVNDVILPLVSGIIGTPDFTNLYVVLKGAVEPGSPLKEAKAVENAVIFAYGSFITEVVSFTILAFVVFLMVRGINKLRKKEEKAQEVAAPAAPAGPTQEELLTEIRDLLSKQK